MRFRYRGEEVGGNDYKTCVVANNKGSQACIVGIRENNSGLVAQQCQFVGAWWVCCSCSHVLYCCCFLCSCWNTQSQHEKNDSRPAGTLARSCDIASLVQSERSIISRAHTHKQTTDTSPVCTLHSGIINKHISCMYPPQWYQVCGIWIGQTY